MRLPTFALRTLCVSSLAACAALAAGSDAPAPTAAAEGKTPPPRMNFPDRRESLVWPKADFPGAAERARGFRAGETFAYRVQWGIFPKAGSMVIETQNRKTDRGSQIVVHSTTRSRGLVNAFYPVAYNARTLIDAQRGRMDELSVEGMVKKENTLAIMLFDYESGLMRYVDSEQPEDNVARSIPYPYPVDYACALLQIRGWDLREGAVHPLLIASKGKFYYIRMEVRALERIDTLEGEQDAYLVEPVSAFPKSKLLSSGGMVSIWISADQRRLPLRFDVKTEGTKVSMRLERYEISEDPLLAQRR